MHGHMHLRRSAQPRGVENGLYPIAGTLIRSVIGLWINIVRHVRRRRPCKQGYDSKPHHSYESNMQHDMQGRLLRETPPHKRHGSCARGLTPFSSFLGHIFYPKCAILGDSTDFPMLWLSYKCSAGLTRPDGDSVALSWGIALREH